MYVMCVIIYFILLFSVRIRRWLLVGRNCNMFLNMILLVCFPVLSLILVIILGWLHDNIHLFILFTSGIIRGGDVLPLVVASHRYIPFWSQVLHFIRIVLSYTGFILDTLLWVFTGRSGTSSCILPLVVDVDLSTSTLVRVNGGIEIIPLSTSIIRMGPTTTPVIVDTCTNTSIDWLSGADTDSDYGVNRFDLIYQGVVPGDDRFNVGVYRDSPNTVGTNTFHIVYNGPDFRSVVDRHPNDLHFDLENLASFQLSHGRNPHAVVLYRP